MKQKFWQLTKLFFLALILLALQISLVKEITSFNINLPLLSIIAIASFCSLELSLYTAMFYIATTYILSYNNTIIFGYAIAALLCYKCNPKNIEDKFLVAMFYCLVLSPIFEIIYNPIKDNLIQSSIQNTITNMICMIPIYFIVKTTLKVKQKR